MTTETTKPEIFAADPVYYAILKKTFEELQIIAGRQGWTALKSWDNLPSSRQSLFVIWNFHSLDTEKIDRIRHLKNKNKYFLLFKDQIPAEGIVDRLTWLDIRDNRRVHLVDIKKDNLKDFFNRFIFAFGCDGNDNHILDAWWENDVFVIVSPSLDGFEKLRVPVNKVKVLHNQPETAQTDFEIDEDGLFIYWPQLDVHLGWEQFEQAVNEKAYLKAKQESEAFNKCYGAAIKTLRENARLRQSDIKGLTPRQVGRIEKGLCRATHSALSKLAKAHQLSVSDYLEELSKLIAS